MRKEDPTHLPFGYHTRLQEFGRRTIAQFDGRVLALGFYVSLMWNYQAAMVHFSVECRWYSHRLQRFGARCVGAKVAEWSFLH